MRQTRRKLVLGAAIAAAAATVPAVTASANDGYYITCYGWSHSNSNVAGGCVEWNNGVVTWYAFDYHGNYWVIH